MAKAVNRTGYHRRYIRGRRKNPAAKTRLCLRCRNYFNSEGPWNRICMRCRGNNKNVNGMMVKAHKS